MARLQRAVLGATRVVGETQTRMTHIQRAIQDTPAATPAHLDRLHELEARLQDLRDQLWGDSTLAGRNEPTPPSIAGRVQRIVGAQWESTSAPTGTNRESYAHAASLFAPVLAELTRLVETDLEALESELEAAGAPWTPGRVPRWEAE